MTRFCLHIICLLLLPWLLTGQYKVEITLLSEDDQPLGDIEVFHHESAVLKLSAKSGLALFDGLSSGENTFTFYSEERTTLTEVLQLDLEAVDIIARRQEYFAIKQLNDIEGTSIFAGKKSEVVLLDLVKGNLALNNSRQVYAQVSGLNIYEGSDGGLQLNVGGRGLDPNRTSNFNTRQNGYDISADVLGYPENYYTPPAEALEEIRVVRGASSLQYGTQFGGLIDFRLRKIPEFKKISILSSQSIASFNTLNTFNYLGVNSGALSFNAYFNYKQGDGYRPNSEYEAANVFTSLGYRLGKRTDLSFEFTYYDYLAKQAGGLSDSQFATTPRLSTRDRNWFDVNWKLYNLKLDHRFNQGSQLTLSLFGLDATRSSVGYRGNPIFLNDNPITSLDEQDREGNYLTPRDLIIGQFRNAGAELRWLHNYSLRDKKSVLLLGSKLFSSNNTAEQGPGSRGTDPDFSFYRAEFPGYDNQSSFTFPNTNVSLFAENIFYLSDKLSLTPGVRWEYIKTISEGTYNRIVRDNAGNLILKEVLPDNRELPRNFVLAGLGLSYKPFATLQLIANVSQNYRSVTFSDIRVVSPTLIVDEDISDEKGLTADIGIRGRQSKLFSYDLTAYSVLYQDRIGTILNGSGDRVRKNIGSAVILGTESLINLNLGHWLFKEQAPHKLQYFINAALAHSRYIKSKENNVVGKKVEFIPDVNLKTGVTYAYKDLELAYQFSFLSEQFTDVQNSAATASGDKREGIIGEIPAYAISDLSLAYQVGDFKFSTGINNLLNENYYTRRATGYPGPGIIPSEGRSYYLTVTYKWEK